MQYNQFMNSKVFFFSERQKYFPGKATSHDDMPVMIHMNYHPDSTCLATTTDHEALGQSSTQVLAALHIQ
eukprot:scaffold16140_cov28-Tisochrysis_lutea.AAC.3